jgi:hypothetical protein
VLFTEEIELKKKKIKKKKDVRLPLSRKVHRVNSKDLSLFPQKVVLISGINIIRAPGKRVRISLVARKSVLVLNFHEEKEEEKKKKRKKKKAHLSAPVITKASLDDSSSTNRREIMSSGQIKNRISS